MSSVSLAAPHELMPALRVLFGHLPDPEGERGAKRCHDALTASADPTGVFVARDDAGRVRGAMLAQALPGALGVAWPPRAPTPDAEDALVRTACEWLAARGVKVCQAFASADELPAAAPLARNGFARVTQLVSMRRELDPEKDGARPEDRLDGAHYLPGLRGLFAAAYLTTHAGTLDCPELDSGRTATEQLAGAELPDGPSPWHFLAQRDGATVGLSQAAPRGDVLELLYLGVVPSARGRGLGGRLLRRLLADAAPAFAAVELSVDARNEPALRLYHRHGFAETGRREVFLAYPGL
jgi:ribosomal protein S18 acetylase RimI-like enzyme